MLIKARAFPDKHPYLFCSPSRLILASDPPSIEYPQTTLRLLVETSFYLSLIIELFSSQIGLNIDLLAGGVVAGSGLFCLFAYHAGRERLPITFYFILFINFIANFSLVIGHGDIPILGDGLTELFHWGTYALVISYLVRNRGAEKRILLFMGILILIAVFVGGVEEIHHGRPRLGLTDVGGNFKNANDLAYFAGFISVALLFFAFQSRALTCVFLCLVAIALVFVCMKTVSRGGTLALSFGIMMFLSTVLFSKSKLRSYLTIASFVVVFAGIFIHFSGPLLLLLERLGETSYDHRVGVYQAAAIDDMIDTFIVGMGQTSAITSEGISAHNSFLHTHIAYGGLAAYAYLAWIVWLGVGVWKSWFVESTSRELKVYLLVAFIMMVISHMFSNRGYLFLSSVYAVAIIEKYTYCHRARTSENSVSLGRHLQ